MLLTIIGSIVYSLLAFICVYAIFKQSRSKVLLIIPIFLESIVIAVILTNKIGLFGLGGLLGFIPLLVNSKQIKI